MCQLTCCWGRCSVGTEMVARGAVREARCARRGARCASRGESAAEGRRGGECKAGGGAKKRLGEMVSTEMGTVARKLRFRGTFPTGPAIEGDPPHLSAPCPANLNGARGGARGRQGARAENMPQRGEPTLVSRLPDMDGHWPLIPTREGPHPHAHPHPHPHPHPHVTAHSIGRRCHKAPLHRRRRGGCFV
jgi:hypothetical protein